MLLGAVVLALYAMDTMAQLRPDRIAATRMRWRTCTPFMPATPRELRHSLAMVTGAAVGEEVLYRGFLIGYLATLTSSWRYSLVVAVVLPAVVFGAGHAYQGMVRAAKVAALTLLFGVIVVLTGTLWIAIVIHFVADLVGMMLGPRLMTTGDAETAGSSQLR